MISKGRAIAQAAGAAIISVLLVAVVGSAYLDHRINQGIQESKELDARIGQAFQGICGILINGSRPYPEPPTRETPEVSPRTPYGKELEEYNKAMADRQAEGRRVLLEAIKTYNC